MSISQNSITACSQEIDDHVVETTTLTGPFKGVEVLIHVIPMFPTDTHLNLKISIANSIGVCNHNQQQISMLIFRVAWFRSRCGLLFTWTIVCCVFPCRQTMVKQNILYTHKYYKIIFFKNVCFVWIISHSWNHNLPQRSVAGYS